MATERNTGVKPRKHLSSFRKSLITLGAIAVVAVGAVAWPRLSTPATASAADTAATTTVVVTTTVTSTVTVTSSPGIAASAIRSSAQAAASAAASSRDARSRSASTTAASTTSLAAVATPSGLAELCGAPANPYGYNYCGRGVEESAPPADICSYFNCIPYFPHGKGHMEECRDTMVSMSGGRRGACSYHGGILLAITG